MTRIIFRRGTAAEWITANPILDEGEPGYETDTTKQKIGDGVTHWIDLKYSGLTNDDIEFPVRSVQGDTGDVRVSLGHLDGVELEVYQEDDTGVVVEPGPVLGEFLGWDENGVAKNIPVNLISLGAEDRYEPKDPQSKYRAYGYAVPRGGTRPTDLPSVAWIVDENDPQMALIEDVYVVDGTTAVTNLPSYLDYTRHILRLGVANTTLGFPPAPTSGGVVIDISIDQDPTTGSRTVTWPSSVRWEKIGGSSAPPVLETAAGSRNRFRFSGTQGRWECMSRVAYAGLASAGPVPTLVSGGTMTGNNGLSNTATNVTAAYPSVVNANDILVVELSLSGNGTVVPDDAAIAALGFVKMEGPITNSDGTPNMRGHLYKKKLDGTEAGTTLTLPYSGGATRGVLTGQIVRGGDFDRVNYVSSRQTTENTPLIYPDITPSVDNSLLIAINSIRYGNHAGVPSVSMPDSAWIERADHYEGRATDGTIVQYGGHLATRALSNGRGVVVTHTSETLSIAGTYVGFIVSVAPVDV